MNRGQIWLGVFAFLVLAWVSIGAGAAFALLALHRWLRAMGWM